MNIRAIDDQESITLEDEFFAGVTLVAGKRGMGKSWTAGVLIEIAHDKGIPFIFIDPQKANLDLASLSGVEIVNTAEADPKRMAVNIAKDNRSVIIIPSGSLEEMQEWVATFITRYMIIEQKAIRLIAIDEAHLFAPNTGTKPPKSLSPIKILATTKRSDGIGFMIITQRLSEMNQTVISQQDSIIFHRFAGMRDMIIAQKSLENDVENSQELKNLLKELKKYEAGETIIISDYAKGGQDGTREKTYT